MDEQNKQINYRLKIFKEDFNKFLDEGRERRAKYPTKYYGRKKEFYGSPNYILMLEWLVLIGWFLVIASGDTIRVLLSHANR